MTAAHEDCVSWGEDIKYRPVGLLSFYRLTAETVSKKKIKNLNYDKKLLLDSWKSFSGF